MKEVRYQVTGPDRKKLVLAIEQIIGCKAVYKRAPSFGYTVDSLCIDREGTVHCQDEELLYQLVKKLSLVGFISEEADMENKSGITIQMPMMKEEEISRLEQLISSKESLLKKAIGVDELTIRKKDDKLEFPWFPEEAGPEEVKAYMDLVEALCKMAKTAKRVHGKDKPVENEKYAFRCFLLRLGFIGQDFKTSRKILLKNFTGSSAFRSLKKDE